MLFGVKICFTLHAEHFARMRLEEGSPLGRLTASHDPSIEFQLLKLLIMFFGEIFNFFFGENEPCCAAVWP
jgi:hypothetical protein